MAGISGVTLLKAVLEGLFEIDLTGSFCTRRFVRNCLGRALDHSEEAVAYTTSATYHLQSHFVSFMRTVVCNPGVTPVVSSSPMG